MLSPLSVMLVVSLTVSALLGVCGRTDPRDITALQDLFVATRGNEWAWQSNESRHGLRWNFTTTLSGDLIHDPCVEDWQAVTVISPNSTSVVANSSSSDCRVTLLFVFDFGLQGSLPPSLGNLDTLLYMQVGRNSLTGVIPDELGNMTSLIYIDFNRNSLVSTIPITFSKLINLQGAFFQNNLLSGSVPMDVLRHWTRLTDFRIDDNLFSNTIPSELSEMSNLLSLSLFGNQLTGTIPSELAKLQMEELFLSTNFLSGSLPSEFGALSALRWLFTSQNTITGTIPTAYGQLAALEVFTCKENAITGTLPSSLGSLSNWLEFSGGGNNLEGSIPSSFSTLGKLSMLDLKLNSLTGSLTPELSGLTALTSLDLSNNHLTGFYSEYFGRWLKLVSLKIHDNAFSGPMPDIHYPLLERCSIQNNMFTGALDLVFDTSKLYDHLINVDLSGNKFSGRLPEKLFEITTLETIALSVNCFTGKLPHTLCEAKSVAVMSLDGLGASEGCEHSVESFFSDVRFFNYLEGTIPECIWNMSHLTSLHLNANGFSGSLHDISSHSPLVDVRLSHNRLIGSIPLSLQQRQFDELDLSFNRITGQYKHAKILSNSSITRLKVNRLSGQLPIDDMAMSTDLNILLGNIFSCGDNNLPQNDKYSEDYVCGSSILNASLLLLIVCTSVVIILLCIIAWLCYRQGSTVHASGHVCKGYDFQEKNILKRFITLARNQNCYFSVIKQLQMSPPPSLRNAEHVIRFYLDLVVMTRLWVLLCLLSIVLSVPIYILKAIDSDATTHDHEYAWQLSWVYTTGRLPALLLLCAWLCLICCFIFAIIYILWIFNTNKVAEKRKSEQANAEPLSRRKSSNTDLSSNQHIDELWNIKTVPLLLFNNALVVGVNLLYIYSTTQQSIASEIQLLIQLLVALFKQLNSTFVLPYLCRAIKDPKRSLLVRLKMSLLQSLLVPCLVTAFQDPSCLRGMFYPSDSVSSSYNYESCSLWGYSDTESVCAETATYHVELVSLTPPFIYHWQCASVLLSAYIPVFIYTYVFQFAYPLTLILLSFFKYTTLPVWMRAKVPGIMWPDNWLQDSPEGCTPEEIAANKYVIARPKRLLNTKTVMSYFANAAVILLTFGLCSPYLALAIIVSTVFTSAVWLMFIGRFMHYRVYGIPSYEDQALIALDLQVGEAIGMLKVCVWPIVVSSCLFFAILCWDMAGDEVGVTDALYIPCIAVSMPVLIWGCIHLFEWKTQLKIFNLRTKKRSGSVVARFVRRGGGSDSGSALKSNMVELRNTFSNHTDVGCLSSDGSWGDSTLPPLPPSPGEDQRHSSPSQAQTRNSLLITSRGSVSTNNNTNNSRFSLFSSRVTISECSGSGSGSSGGSGVVSPLHLTPPASSSSSSKLNRLSSVI